MQHSNARLTPAGRRRLVSLVEDDLLSLTQAARREKYIWHVTRLNGFGNFKHTLFLFIQQGSKSFGLFKNFGMKCHGVL